MEKGKNAVNKYFLPFPQCFLLYNREKSSWEIIILTKFNLLSANAFSLVACKILLFGKGLTSIFLCFQPCFLLFSKLIASFYSVIFILSLALRWIWTSLKLSHLEFTLYQKTQFWTGQIESICRRQNKCERKIEISYGKGRKHYVKRRKCRLPAFLLFPITFFNRILIQGR